MKMKSKNHEICQDLTISYVEDVVENGEGFAQYVMYDVYKMKYLRRRIVALRRIQYDLESKRRSN